MSTPRHLIFTSTVCTYGVDYDWLPATEDHPLRPISDYGRNKAAADHTLLAAHHAEGFPVTIVNPAPAGGISNAISFPVTGFVLGVPNPSVAVTAGQDATYTVYVGPHYGSFDSAVRHLLSTKARSVLPPAAPDGPHPGRREPGRFR